MLKVAITDQNILLKPKDMFIRRWKIVTKLWSELNIWTHMVVVCSLSDVCFMIQWKIQYLKCCDIINRDKEKRRGRRDLSWWQNDNIYSQFELALKLPYYKTRRNIFPMGHIWTSFHLHLKWCTTKINSFELLGSQSTNQNVIFIIYHEETLCEYE